MTQQHPITPPPELSWTRDWARIIRSDCGQILITRIDVEDDDSDDPKPSVRFTVQRDDCTSGSVTLGFATAELADKTFNCSDDTARHAVTSIVNALNSKSPGVAFLGGSDD